MQLAMSRKSLTEHSLLRRDLDCKWNFELNINSERLTA